MDDTIHLRVLDGARLILAGYTVREAAVLLGVCKSTVHRDVTDRLLRIDRRLAGRVRRVLDRHAEESAARGGAATQRVWLRLREAAE